MCGAAAKWCWHLRRTRQMLWLIAVILTPLAALYFYLCHQLGSTTVHAVSLLLIRGCITFEKVSWKPLAVKGLALRECTGAKPLTLFQAETLRFERVRGVAFILRLSKPRVNLLGNSEGLLHIVALLQDVGYFEERRAAKPPKSIARPSRDGDATILEASQAAEKEGSATEKCETAFQAEVHMPCGRITLRDGTLEVFEDIRQLLGSSVRLTAAAGTTPVARMSRKLGLDTSDAPSTSQNNGAQCASDGTREPRLRYPVLLSLQSDHLRTHLVGWRSDRGFVLQRPMQSQLHFTPEIAQLVLSKLHPLLGYAVSLQGKDEICASIVPLDMHLPCEMLSLRLEPIKVLLQTKKLVKGLLKLLSTVGKLDWQEPCTLQAWTSSIAADVYRSGLVVSKRLDLLLGHDVQAGKGIHISMWGQVDAGSDAVDMVLGIPAHSLRRMGAKHIASDFVYQIAVGGRTQSPEIDWLRAAKDLAEIILKSRMRQGMPMLAKMFRATEVKFEKQGAVPPPTLPFPWEAFETEDIVDSDNPLTQHEPYVQ